MTSDSHRAAGQDCAARPAHDAWTYLAHNESGTQQLASALAECLPVGSVVVLSGPLGAGKTRFVQFFAAAAGVDASTVNSPTFVLCQLYEGNRSIVHLDVYRVKNEEEFLNLGPDELFAGSDVTFIEWGERVRNCLPNTCVELSIDVAGAESRRFTLRAPPELIQSVAGRLDSESE